MLTSIFGTKTKVKLIQILAGSHIPRTRRELARIANTGMKSTYTQIEELVGLGVVRYIDNGLRKRVELNPEFPLYDSILDIILASKTFEFGLPEILRRIDDICGDDYYIGHFIAAKNLITPIDYDSPVVVVNILKDVYDRHMKRLGGLKDISPQSKLVFSETSNMPVDIYRGEVLGVEIWLASIERGAVECLADETRNITTYGSYLILVQNAIDGTMDIKRLKKIASESHMRSRLLAIMYKFNVLTDQELFPLTANEKNIGKKNVKLVDLWAAKNVLNTIWG